MPWDGTATSWDRRVTWGRMGYCDGTDELWLWMRWLPDAIPLAGGLMMRLMMRVGWTEAGHRWLESCLLSVMVGVAATEGVERELLHWIEPPAVLELSDQSTLMDRA